MSRQRLENQAKSFLLEIDQEQEISDILNNDQQNINATQLINQININSRMSQAVNSLGGWNGVQDELSEESRLFQTKNQRKQVRNKTGRNMRAISAQNENSPRENLKQIQNLQGTEAMDFVANFMRKNSLQIQENKKNFKSRLQRSFDRDQQQQRDKFIENGNKEVQYSMNYRQNMEDIQQNDINSENDDEEEEDILQMIGKKRQARVINKVKQKLNILNSPKNLDQAKLNLFEQVSQRHTAVFTPFNISRHSPISYLVPQQQQQLIQTPQNQAISPKMTQNNNQIKIKIDMIQEKIQQYIDQNDKTVDAFKKITEIRRNSLLLQKTQSKQLPIQTHEFIPVELINKNYQDYGKLKENSEQQVRVKPFNEQLRQRDNLETQKQREIYKNYLEQQSQMPQIDNTSSKANLTPRVSSQINKIPTSNQGQSGIQNQSYQGSAQNTPLKSKQYRLTPTETRKLIDHIERQGRNYLSSSPTKTKSNGIKFRISKKSSIIEPPTIQVTPNYLNSISNHNGIHTSVLDSINFEEENSNSTNNLKQIILQKISQQNSPNKIIDLSTRSAQGAYKSLKKQRMINSQIINQNSNISSLFHNSTYKNSSQILDQSNYTNSIQLENSSALNSNKPNDVTISNKRFQNQCKVEDFFNFKQEAHSAPLKSRPKMNIQKLNQVKQMNFELENALCKQSPISSIAQTAKYTDYNHQVSLNFPSQQKMNKIVSTDSQPQFMEYEKTPQRVNLNYRNNSIERRRAKANVQNMNQDQRIIEMFCSTPINNKIIKETTSQKSKENQQIQLNQLSQNHNRLNEKNIHLHPKNLF
ncbi:hypothetical protein TTHERM_00277340 (macronuclear) [Tetrahymena thermophila SB210]|uniref:Uncharacterized protein n=1 Tax=Tetrahymena thermophila (strain SB210) TaxID=312017 RepID=I7MK85_TETTS|nr:hypothetical protein TTHERM_00277340 [Tetrahymena thermophila SB210]EAR97849.1 hypothetical protein TTHERM_00277340 [Tetrahymena thermophila SB210]|eukprot:XP_001018094.1 hypothetical protein TTHERM_00277340 [Tetrahymena thermophila SB210]